MKRSVRLPLALELTAGPGSQAVKSLPPSVTLLASAAYFKSLFVSSDKEETPPEETVKNKVLDIWNNIKYGD